MATRYIYVRAPVEIGLNFFLNARIEWLRDEKKALITETNLQEIKFENRPKDILEQLNNKKCKLLDYIELDIKFEFEDSTLIIVGEETMLGKFKEGVAKLSSIPPSGYTLPNSLKSLKTAILVGDLIQLDNRKGKTPYHLRQVAAADDVLLQWVSTQDIEILDQRDKDLKLVQLSKNIQSLQLEDAQVVNSTDKGTYNEMDEAEGEVDDMNSSTYEDSTQ